jgi:hypothetical protein
MKTLTLNLDENVFNELQLILTEYNKTPTELIEEIIKEYKKEQIKNTLITESLNLRDSHLKINNEFDITTNDDLE